MSDPITMKPILFGNAVEQERLLEVFRDGSIPKLKKPFNLSQSAGLLFVYRDERKFRRLALDSRHPAYSELLDTLTWLNQGAGFDEQARPKPPKETLRIDPTRPLLLNGFSHFRILQVLQEHGELSRKELGKRSPALGRTSTDIGLGILRKYGLIVGDDVIRIADVVPMSFRQFVQRTGRHLSVADSRYTLDIVGVHQVAAYGSAADGAPRIFATDIRLRHLMALAKYGAMHFPDLERLIGSDVLKSEGRDYAPFGRGGVVRTFRTRHGRAAMLDTAHPAYRPLKRFLLAMEQAYPLPELHRKYPAPSPPEKKPWRGDKLALFGAPVPTSILLSIGPMAWTFEALCCELATGYDRVVVKKAMMRLEEEGVIMGDRPRKPGFNVRVVRINPDFPAAAALQELIEVAARAWDWDKKVAAAMAKLHPRTKEQLRRRGLIPCDCHPGGGHPPSMTTEYMASRHGRLRRQRQTGRLRKIFDGLP